DALDAGREDPVALGPERIVGAAADDEAARPGLILGIGVAKGTGGERIVAELPDAGRFDFFVPARPERDVYPAGNESGCAVIVEIAIGPGPAERQREVAGDERCRRIERAARGRRGGRIG